MSYPRDNRVEGIRSTTRYQYYAGTLYCQSDSYRVIVFRQRHPRESVSLLRKVRSHRQYLLRRAMTFMRKRDAAEESTGAIFGRIQYRIAELHNSHWRKEYSRSNTGTLALESGNDCENRQSIVRFEIHSQKTFRSEPLGVLNVEYHIKSRDFTALTFDFT
jgi:hypothetical protein